MSISIKWIPYHSWFKIQIGDQIIHIDPAFYKAYPGVESEFADKADFILITHAHHDHCDLKAIEKLKKSDTTIIAPISCKNKIIGEFDITEAGAEKTIMGINFKTVHAYNIGKNFHPKSFGVGYLISFNNKSIYHAGDTDFIPEMETLGKIDVALLPIGGTYTMDLMEAVDSLNVINPEIVIPMHQLEADPEKFKEIVESTTKSKVVILKQGEVFNCD